MANPNAADAAVVIAPADLASSQTGGWVSLKGAAGVTLTFNKGAGTAGQPPVLTFRQATNASGANAKDLATVTTIYKKNAGSNTWTKVTQAAGASYTGDVAAGLYKIDISGSQLDVANGFCAVSVNIASSGAAAQLGGIVGELYGLRYGGSLDTALAPFSAEAASDPDEARAQEDKERARERALDDEGDENAHKAQAHAQAHPGGEPATRQAFESPRVEQPRDDERENKRDTKRNR